MYLNGRVLALALLVTLVGIGLVWNSLRSLREGEGMYDRESTQQMQWSG